jgi:hypothetical protein
MAKENGECSDIAASSACNRGWVIKSTLFCALDEIGPIGGVF